VCDIIWCKKEIDGKVCNTVNYLDPYCFWNWEGKVNCAECGTVYYIHMIQGFMYRGPEEKPGEKPDTSPLVADRPLDGYRCYIPGLKEGPGRISASPVGLTSVGRTWFGTTFEADWCEAGGPSRPPRPLPAVSASIGMSRNFPPRSGRNTGKRSKRARPGTGSEERCVAWHS